MRGRPPKHFHPLFQKEKELHETLNQILPEEIVNSLSPKSSRLAHLYGLPKTHKTTLSMRPILSATGTYNYNLAKWLEQKLQPLSLNEYTITDAFAFADEIRTHTMSETDILVNKAFTDDWFNKTYGLNLQQDQLARLLEMATTNQLFQFNGQLYQQTHGVAMGSPLGPLMANVFMCHLEEKLTRDGLMPQLYKRYVDNTLARMPSAVAAAEFLSTLNGLHPSLTFTMELPVDNKIPFIGIEIVKNET